MDTEQENNDSGVATVSANEIQKKLGMDQVEIGQDIVITPEMIDAGQEALSSFRQDFDSAAETVKEVFEAMIFVSQHSQK
jgi:hypothetical protein